MNFKKKILKPVGRELKQFGNQVARTTKSAFSVSLEYPPNVKQIMKKFGDEVIVSITLKRTPVSELLTGALSVFSMGKFGKRMEKSFDELFHLFMDIVTESGKTISLEKNERINMIVNPSKRPHETKKSVSNIPDGITLNELMENTHQQMGNQFFRYDAVSNNCQDFLLNVIQANGIGDNSDVQFIKQDTEKLFKNMPILKGIAHTATDVGAIANKTIQGGNVRASSNPWIQHVKNYASENNMSYRDALKDANCKNTYHR